MNLKLFAARLKLHWNLDPKMEPQEQWWFPSCFSANIYIYIQYISCRFELWSFQRKEPALISSKKISDNKSDNLVDSTLTVLRVGPYLPSHDGNSKDVSMKIDDFEQPVWKLNKGTRVDLRKDMFYILAYYIYIYMCVPIYIYIAHSISIGVCWGTAISSLIF